MAVRNSSLVARSAIAVRNSSLVARSAIAVRDSSLVASEAIAVRRLCPVRSKSSLEARFSLTAPLICSTTASAWASSKPAPHSALTALWVSKAGIVLRGLVIRGVLLSDSIRQ